MRGRGVCVRVCKCESDRVGAGRGGALNGERKGRDPCTETETDDHGQQTTQMLT